MNLLLLQSSQLLLLPSKRAMQVKGGIRVPQLLKKGILGRASMYPSKNITGKESVLADPFCTTEYDAYAIPKWPR